jgi:histidine ammonia-lyase
MKQFSLKPGALTLPILRTIAKHHMPLALQPSAYKTIALSADVVKDVVKAGKPVYGVNTGFGALAKKRISDADLAKLQRNLVLSHAAGVGKFLDDDVVRLMMVLKINTLAQGFSGVRREVIDLLIALHNAEVYPCIPEKGSVGASGDLAPLAHMSLALIGEGQVRVAGVLHDAKSILKKLRLDPVVLGPKEGLALLNGTQASTALALRGLFRAEECFAAGIVAGALSVDAAKGSTTPFDAEIHAIRGQKGQIDAARLYQELLKDSAIRASHDNDDDDRVQDPYCLRCMPQVMGACLDQLRHVADIFLREANGVSDNPLVFAEEHVIKSGGNFHAEPIALAADTLALVIAEIGAMSERRTAMLIDAKMSGLPAFLIRNAGLNSGFMIAQVTAAALASENKQLATPASVDSLPTSANQEDHVSMATYAARRLVTMAGNTAVILGVELMASAQGIHFHAPLKTAKPLQAVIALLRQSVPFYEEDRHMAPDIRAAARLVEAGSFLPYLGRGILPSVE